MQKHMSVHYDKKLSKIQIKKGNIGNSQFLLLAKNITCLHRRSNQPKVRDLATRVKDRRIKRTCWQRRKMELKERDGCCQIQAVCRWGLLLSFYVSLVFIVSFLLGCNDLVEILASWEGSVYAFIQSLADLIAKVNNNVSILANAMMTTKKSCEKDIKIHIFTILLLYKISIYVLSLCIDLFFINKHSHWIEYVLNK